MPDPEVRRVLGGTSIAHLATVLPDGSPHATPVFAGVSTATGSSCSPVRARARRATCARDPRMALSIAPAENPFEPVAIRGRVAEWLEGDAAWEIVDQLAMKYTGHPYPRGQERVVAVIEPERQTVERPTTSPGRSSQQGPGIAKDLAHSSRTKSSSNARYLR